MTENNPWVCVHGHDSRKVICTACGLSPILNLQLDYKYERIDKMIDDKSDAGSWAEALAYKDAINPDHYKVGGIETIGYLQAKLSPEEFAGYCRGNALKYLSRAGHKDDAAQEYRKAKWYIERLISCLDTEPAP